MKKAIEILIGIPCSGKSTYAWDMCTTGNDGIYEISRDNIRLFKFKQPYIYSKSNEEKITELFDQQVKIYLELHDCICLILDNTHCKEKYIDQIIRKYPNCEINVRFFDISLQKAHYRNIVRYFKTGKWIPISVINNMKKSYDNINKEKYKSYELV